MSEYPSTKQFTLSMLSLNSYARISNAKVSVLMLVLGEKSQYASGVWSYHFASVLLVWRLMSDDFLAIDNEERVNAARVLIYYR
ncbi:hypothetical protein SAMN05216262_11369 [Colwellia chukchiensis]|uniref:Uncharacterized protein n=1 Tax=Colwellia chukchiensis TaxID=641665 RepID=A0A1H7R3E3_9GAMM|nr:hypothetical protein SAMN05216262_11369 [Colwellia chukchiensis]